MPLYLGKNQLKLNLNRMIYNVNISMSNIISNVTILISRDNFILTDKYGVYLIAKEDK